MKPETLKPENVKSPAGLGHRLELDEAGCLFDRGTRDFLPAMKNKAAIEALAALQSAARAIHLAMERWAEEHGLSQGRLQVLFMLRKAGENGLPLGRLAEMQRVSPRNVTGLIDGLERDGLVERVPDPNDRRSIQARLTVSGRERIEAIWKPALDQQVPFVDGFTDAELTQLRHLALRVLQNYSTLGGKSE